MTMVSQLEHRGVAKIARPVTELNPRSQDGIRKHRWHSVSERGQRKVAGQ